MRDAEQWLSARGVDLAPALLALMPALITDGFLIGAVAAEAAASGAATASTGAWQPGSTAAAQQQVTQLGYGAALNAQVAAAAALAVLAAEGYAAALAAVLAAAAGGGLTVAVLAAGLSDALADPEHARAAALDRILAASGHAARTVYSGRGISMGRWQTEDDGKVCPACSANEAAGPQPLGAAYPSGAAQPPGHPRCRCALFPASGESQAALLRRVLNDGYVPVELGGTYARS